MKTCKTCNHWGSGGGEYDWGRLKTCSAPMIKYGYGIKDDDVADNGVVVENDEGWGMLTGPDFGCVLHEGK